MESQGEQGKIASKIQSETQQGRHKILDHCTVNSCFNSLHQKHVVTNTLFLLFRCFQNNCRNSKLNQNEVQFTKITIVEL